MGKVRAMDLSFLDQIPFISELPQEVQRILVGLVLFFVLLLVFSLLRGLLKRLIIAPIRGMAGSTRMEIDDALVQAVDGAITFFVLALTLFLVTAILNFQGHFETFMFRLSLTLLVIGFVRFFYDLGSRLAGSRELLQRLSPGQIRASFVPLVRYTVRFLVLAIGALFIAEIWAFNIAGLVAGLGLGGLAVSLAAKEVLDDFLGFLVIIYDNLFTSGEYIVSEHGEGIVEHIGLRSTTIRRLDQGVVYAPNGQLANASITNWSRLDKRWFNFMLGISFEATADQIEQLVSRVKAMLKARQNVQQGSPVVLFTEYGDYALNILIRCYVTIEDWTKAHEERHAVNLEIMRIVSELGVSVALPSRSVYLEEIPPGIAGSNGKSAKPQHEHKRQTVRSGSAAASMFHQGDDDANVEGHEEGRDDGSGANGDNGA